MFEMLCKNQEIRSFLEAFPHHHWRKVIEGVSLFGIRKLKSHKLPLTITTIEDILSPKSTDLKSTLNTMKQELNELGSAIKRIERKTQSSADLYNDHKIVTKPNKILHNAEKKRTSSSKLLAKASVHFTERSYTPSFNLFGKDLKEPRVCPLNDAQKLIQCINTPRTNIPEGDEVVKIANEFLRTKPSHGIQNTSPKFAGVGYSPKGLNTYRY